MSPLFYVCHYYYICVTITTCMPLILHVCHYYLGSNELKPANLNKKRESVISTAATMRVLNVLRHWVSKHSQVRHNGTCTCYNIIAIVSNIDISL